MFLSGLFYLVPLKDPEKMSAISLVTIISKIGAVLFLIFNASFTPNQNVIYLAAIGDGIMAIALSITYLMFIKEVQRKKPKL